MTAGEPIELPELDAETLLGLALEWQQLADAASQSSRQMAAMQFPISKVLEAQQIARRALELAAALQKWADHAEQSR